MSEKLKICQLCNVGFALDKLLLPLINAQLKCGHNVISVCTKDEYSKRLKDSGYKVEFISIVRGINPLSHMYTIWKIFCFLRGENFDLIHVHTPVAALLGRIAAWLCGVPLVVYTAHGFYFHNDMSKIKKAFFIGLERFSGRITDLLFTQSGEDAKTAVIEGISSIDRVFAIGNGVDVNIFNLDLNVNNKIREQVRDELNIPEHAFLVGMIGRQVKEKGILELLKAAEVLIDKYVDIYFLIVIVSLTQRYNLYLIPANFLLIIYETF